MVLHVQFYMTHTHYRTLRPTTYQARSPYKSQQNHSHTHTHNSCTHTSNTQKFTPASSSFTPMKKFKINLSTQSGLTHTITHACIHTLKKTPKTHTNAQHTFIQICILPNQRKFRLSTTDTPANHIFHLCQLKKDPSLRDKASFPIPVLVYLHI